LHTVNLSGGEELQALLHGLRALQSGDSSVRLPTGWSGTAGEVARVFNEVAAKAPERSIAERPSNGSGHHANGDATPGLNGHAAALLGALQAVKKGDASVRLPLDWTGIDGKIADAFNDMVELNARTQSELARLSRVVGKEGKLKQRA
jgi:hypothetical protein